MVDPEKGSIVCIRSFKVDGKEITGTALIRLMGNNRDDYQSAKTYRQAVDRRLDGNQTYAQNPEADLRIVELAETAGKVLTIRSNTAARVAQNSLGVFVNSGRL